MVIEVELDENKTRRRIKRATWILINPSRKRMNESQRKVKERVNKKVTKLEKEKKKEICVRNKRRRVNEITEKRKW